MTAKIKSQISKIGWYQIIGGGIGVAIIAYSLFGLAEFSWVNVSIYLFMLRSFYIQFFAECFA